MVLLEVLCAPEGRGRRGAGACGCAGLFGHAEAGGGVCGQPVAGAGVVAAGAGLAPEFDSIAGVAEAVAVGVDLAQGDFAGGEGVGAALKELQVGEAGRTVAREGGELVAAEAVQPCLGDADLPAAGGGAGGGERGG